MALTRFLGDDVQEVLPCGDVDLVVRVLGVCGLVTLRRYGLKALLSNVPMHSVRDAS